MSGLPLPGGPGALAALATPWALLALLLLPLLAWLYRRRPRPPAQELPSLLFLEPEAAPPAAREARRVDAGLWLACTAAALLALAAATPLLGTPPGARVVRVVVSGGVPSTQQGYAGRVEAALAEVRGGLVPGDRLEVVHLPSGPGSERLPRPSEQALLAAARAGRPARAIVVSDLRVGEAEVLARPVGDGALGNVGLVAVARREGGLHVLVRNDSPRAARATLLHGAPSGLVLAQWPLSLAPGEVRAVALAGPPAAGALWLEHAAPGQDALAADDRVGLGPERLRVRLDERLPGELRAALRAALVAALGEDGVHAVGDGSVADLRVVPLEALAGPARAPGEPRAPHVPVLALAVRPAGEAGVEVPQAPEQRAEVDLVRDVSLAGLRVWRPSAQPSVPGLRWLLARAGVGLVGETPAGDVLVAVDLLAGAPPLASQPAWPLLVDNLVRRLLGVPSQGEPGLRLTDLHAPGSTRLGREQAALPAGWRQASGPAAVPDAVVPRSLAPLLALAACLLLAALWWREALGRPGPASR